MATLTSVKSGYWNDPTVWDLGVVPADGDSVTVAAGHTVTFNVDQSGFTNGLAGLTINGTLKIPSQAEDPNMPDTVVLKVNANIAGSGSLLIGSQTNPINYPQTAKILINGSITTAIVQIYGAARNPFFDFPAAPIPANATSFQLQNGLPLQAGDTIAIGRGNYKGDPWIYYSTDLYFTVQSYDSTTKTVTLTSAIVNARPTNSLVCLVSRAVTIQRYGASSSIPLVGSARTVQGCLIDAQNIVYKASEASSSNFTNVVAINGMKGSHSIFPSTTTFTDILLVNGHQGWRQVPGISVTNAVLLSILNGLCGDGSGSFKNVWVQNTETAVHTYSSSYGYTVDTMWVAGVSDVIGAGRADLIKNLTVDYANTLVKDGATLFNVTCGANVSVIWDGLSGRTGTATPNIQNLTLQGSNTSMGFLGVIHDCIIKNLNGNLPTPPHNIDSNSLAATSPIKAMYFTEWQGFGSYPQARGRYFRHGRVVSDVLANPPAPNTFKFFLSETTNIQPIYLDWQVNGGGTIQVTGTISQLGTNEVVKVQIFSVHKEPLLGDIPDYEQTYTTTGDINISWTPPSAGTWIVRVLAYPQQTTNPVTIANLQVAGGGTGGGQTYNINVTDGITPSLSDAANIAASLMVTDSLNPTLTDQASLSAQIALSDAINPTLQDQSQAQVQVDLSDSINPTLQDIVDVESGTFYNISVSDQITPSLADSVDEQIAVSVSESISPQLQDQASSSIQISASEMISPTLQEQVSEQAQISVNETIMPTLQDLPTTQVGVSASETIAPTLQEQVTVTAGGTYHIVEPLDIDITEDELEVD
jgi:hypothetical protein